MHKLNGIIAGFTIRGLTSLARRNLGERRKPSASNAGNSVG